MAGKRPDQHNIDPREAGATDYKSLPQTGHGGSALDDTVELDRQRVGQEESRMRAESGPIPGSRPAPSTYTRYGRPLESEEGRDDRMEGRDAGESRDEDRMEGRESGELEEMEGLSGREREARGTEDPRERGVGG
jgi:hypothetical protein